MRHLRRQQIHLAFADGHVGRPAILQRFQQHVPPHLVEEFLAGVVVKILARIGTADGHDDEVAVFEQQLVAHRRLEQIAILIDPLLQVERHGGWHAFII